MDKIMSAKSGRQLRLYPPTATSADVDSPLLCLIKPCIAACLVVASLSFKLSEERMLQFTQNPQRAEYEVLNMRSLYFRFLA